MPVYVTACHIQTDTNPWCAPELLGYAGTLTHSGNQREEVAAVIQLSLPVIVFCAISDERWIATMAAEFTVTFDSSQIHSSGLIMHSAYPVISAQVPAQTLIARHLPDAYFYDAWQVRAAHPELSLLQQFQRAFSRSPKWVELCMGIRNRVVSQFGLKDLGNFKTGARLTAATGELQAGQAIGIFQFIAQTEHELLVGDDDKHLTVRLSLHRNADDLLTLSTVVHVKNNWGKLYMLPVTPMHKLIAPATLKILGQV